MRVVLPCKRKHICYDGSNHINGKQSVLVKQPIQTNIRVVVAVILAAAFSVAFGAHAFAQSTPATNSANVIKVSPVRTDMEVAAGTSKTVKMTVTNLTKASITVKPIMNDFVAGDERGTPALILDEKEYAPTHSLKRFMKPLPNITVEAGKYRTVDVVLTVPKDAQAGGYFGAVRFAPTTPDGGGQVNLSGSVASLILMSVPGPAVEKLDMTEFNIQQGGKTGNYFQSSNDLQATVRFQSKSNIQLGPIGKLSVKEGDKVIYDTDFNNKEQRDMILPDSARRWDFPLKNIGSFGNYTVIATFTYGSKNQTIEVTRTFWVVPQVVIFIAVGVTIALILLILGIFFFLRSYKRRVLRNHRGGFRR